MESIRVKQNNDALYKVATLLKDLNEHVVYVGGRIVGLLITDLIEDDVRPTYDIDVALDLGRTDIVALRARHLKSSTFFHLKQQEIVCNLLHYYKYFY